ncbi:MAG TPA: COX15/CtaA family protein [Methylophilaceae bacterium]|nr:COX15/CtaA family protein [Methylophilaceae bacterium]
MQGNSLIWFRRLALFATLLVLCVVVLGAYVRLSDAGLGCPDWPGCYGALTVPQSEAAITHAQTAYPDKPIETHKAWKEMLHRYVAGTLGLLILAIVVLGWRARKLINVSPWVPTLLLLVVGFQAALGMWTVTLLLKPVIVTAHLLGGMTTLGLLTWIAHRHWGVIATRFVNAAYLRLWIRGALLVVLAQVFLGGWTSSNYAALACTDFPTCHGVWVPDMDFSTAFHWVRELGHSADGKPLELAAFTAIQWTHRLGALVTFIYLGFVGICLLKIPPMKVIGLVLIAVLVAQISMGIANLVLHLPLLLAVGHNLGAALLVITVVVMNSKITSLIRGDFI